MADQEPSVSRGEEAMQLPDAIELAIQNYGAAMAVGNMTTKWNAKIDLSCAILAALRSQESASEPVAWLLEEDFGHDGHHIWLSTLVTKDHNEIVAIRAAGGALPKRVIPLYRRSIQPAQFNVYQDGTLVAANLTTDVDAPIGYSIRSIQPSQGDDE